MSPLRRLALAAMAHALFGASLGLLVLLPVHLRALGVSNAFAGFVNGIAFGVGLGIRPLAGWALDRFGRRPALLAGGAAAVLGGAGYLAAGDAIGPALFAARVLTGAAEGTLFTGFFVYAADVVPAERRAQGIALFGISGLLPMAVAPAIGERIVAVGGFSALYWTSLGGAALSLALTACLAETHAAPAGGPSLVAGMARVLSARALRGVWVLAGTFGVGMAAAQTFVAPMSAQRGVEGGTSAFFAAYGGSAILLRLLAGGLPDRVGPARVAGPALLVYALSLAALAPPTTAWWTLALSGALGGVGHSFLFPTASALCIARAPPGARGAALAATTGMLDLCFFAASPALGFLGDRHGYPTLFAAAGALVLLGIVLWRRVERSTTA